MITEELQEQKQSELEEPLEENPSPKKIVQLVATGGGSNGGPWLTWLEVGSCFLARPKDSKSAMLHEFWIISKRRRAFKLLNVQSEREVYMWADPVEFSKEFNLYEVVDP